MYRFLSAPPRHLFLLCLDIRVYDAIMKLLIRSAAPIKQILLKYHRRYYLQKKLYSLELSMNFKSKLISYMQALLLTVLFFVKLFYIEKPVSYCALISVVVLMFISIAISSNRLYRNSGNYDKSSRPLLVFSICTINLSYMVIIVYMA